MRAGAVAIATFLLWSWSAAAAADDPASVTVEVGGVSIELPAPVGHVEITNERMRKLIEALVPAENRHLTSFAPSADLDRVGGGVGLIRWGSVHAVREVENLSLLEADFGVVRAQVLTAWKDELEKVAQFVDEELVKSSERVREAVNIDMQFAATDYAPVEIVADEADAFSTMMLVRSEVKSQGQAIEAKLIVTTTIMRLNDRLVALYYYDQHRSDADIVAAREATRTWIAAVRAANIAP